MAQILPFRAVHYNSEKAGGLEKVVTQPYDKITPEMRSRYYGLSPYNLARIIRGQPEPGDGRGENVYTRADSHFRQWLSHKVLVAEREPAIYPYHQKYCLPGQTSETKLRKGFIALVRLEDYAARVVYRHEETLSGPRADRLELLKATRAHFGHIFVLYSDPEAKIERELDRAARGKPWKQVTDEYSTEHTVWRATDDPTIEIVAAAMREKQLVIADGHHRYETGLAYRNECRMQGRDDKRAEFIMATLIRQESDALTVLPTHRVLHGLANFEWAKFLAEVKPHFAWSPLAAESAGPAGFAESLRKAGASGPSFGFYAGKGLAGILTLRAEADLNTLLPAVPRGLRQLDVVLLHAYLFEKVLEIDRSAVREERNLRYVRDFGEALAQVDRSGSQLAFLMNPTPVRSVWENALAGNVLPQKSTDFYPKLLSGLTIYWLDNPAVI